MNDLVNYYYRKSNLKWDEMKYFSFISLSIQYIYEIMQMTKYVFHQYLWILAD